MKQRGIDSPFVLRYVYSMLAVVLVAVTVIVSSLYIGQRDESRTRDQVQSFHLESYVESDLLLREASKLRALAGSSPAASIPPGTVAVQLSFGGLLESMMSRLKRLSALQAQYEYDGDATAATLERLVDRFNRIDVALSDTTVTPDVIAWIDALTLTINQFRRLHTIAADSELQQLAERQDHRPRFLGVLIVCIGFAVLAMYYLTRSLRASLIRQQESEAALAQSQEQLQNVQKLDALAQLVGGVAHDFNNLLTAVLGHTELLRESTTGNEQLQTGLNEIRKAGLRATALTQQLLAFSRRQKADRSVLDLNELLLEMENILQRTVGDQVELICTYTDDPFPVEIDPGQLQQIMINLVSNARDAMPDGGTLAVITENVSIGGGMDGVPEGDYLQVCVTDSGTGMDEFTRRRVFEPFFTTKEKGTGTGLGLSTVHGIVTDSKGYIVAESESGRGTEFRIYFPRAEGQPVVAAEHVEPDRPTKGSETILIVDDDKQVLRFAEKGLSSQGYRVLTASSGADGLEICKHEPGDIHAIVSDVVMSGLNGPQFMSRALRLRPHATSVYISAYNEEIILWRPKEQQDIPLVKKPFEMRTLAQVLRDRLDQLDQDESSGGGS